MPGQSLLANGIPIRYIGTHYTADARRMTAGAAVAGPAGSAVSQMRLIIHVASIVGSKQGSVIVLDAADEDEAKKIAQALA
jgi:hypothetical protein